MEATVIYNANLHFEHQLWKGELNFWKDELKFFNNRLSELVTRWTNNEMLIQLEHYQNEFMLHGGVIEDLLDVIQEHELQIAEQSKTGRESLNRLWVKKHNKFREHMETQRYIYADLKREFFRFLEKYMWD